MVYIRRAAFQIIAVLALTVPGLTQNSLIGPLTVDVRVYGAVGDGVTDSTAAFQTAIDIACSDTNATGEVVVPAAYGHYRVNLTRIIGDGSAAAHSTKCNSFSLRGDRAGSSSSEFANQGATVIEWFGATGGTTTLFDIRGPIANVRISDLTIIGNGAATAIRGKHTYNFAFERLNLVGFGSDPIYIDAYPSPTGVVVGANDGRINEVKISTDGRMDSGCFHLGGSTYGSSPHLDVAKLSMLNVTCQASAGVKAFNLGFVDALTLINIHILSGLSGFDATAVTGGTQFPQNLICINCTVIPAAKCVVDAGWTGENGGGVRFWPYLNDGGDPNPTSRFCSGIGTQEYTLFKNLQTYQETHLTLQNTGVTVNNMGGIGYRWAGDTSDRLRQVSDYFEGFIWQGKQGSDPMVDLMKLKAPAAGLPAVLSPVATLEASLGSSLLKWKNLYVENGYIDNLSFTGGTLPSGTQVTPNAMTQGCLEFLELASNGTDLVAFCAPAAITASFVVQPMDTGGLSYHLAAIDIPQTFTAVPTFAASIEVSGVRNLATAAAPWNDAFATTQYSTDYKMCPPFTVFTACWSWLTTGVNSLGLFRPAGTVFANFDAAGNQVIMDGVIVTGSSAWNFGTIGNPWGIGYLSGVNVAGATVVNGFGTVTAQVSTASSIATSSFFNNTGSGYRQGGTTVINSSRQATLVDATITTATGGGNDHACFDSAGKLYRATAGVC